MQYTIAGAMVDSWWHAIPMQFPAVMLDVAVVMPNHLHAILHIGASPESTNAAKTDLSAVIQWFKIRSTNDYIVGVKRYGFRRFDGHLWQPRFHDHIIRSDRALEEIRVYIAGNPAKWEIDRHFVP